MSATDTFVPIDELIAQEQQGSKGQADFVPIDTLIAQETAQSKPQGFFDQPVAALSPVMAMVSMLSGKRAPGPSINDVVNPYAAERQQVGNKVAQDIQTGKEAFGATGVGQLLQAGTSPVIKKPLDFLTSPPVVSTLVREGLNPINYVGMRGAKALEPEAATAGKMVGKAAGDIGEAFKFSPVSKNATAEELLRLTEQEAARLPKVQRQAYLTLKGGVAQDALATQKATFANKAQKALQFIQERKVSANKSLPETAVNDIEQLKTQFRPLLKSQSDAYSSGINNSLANAEAASGTEITFTKQELDQALANKYLKPTQAGTPNIAMENQNLRDYQELTDLLNQHQITNQNEISARSLLNIADKEYQTVGSAAKQGLRALTPRELASQHLRDILLSELEKKGVDVSATKQMWADWIPVRNLGFKLQAESGPSKLVGIVSGKNPVGAKNLNSLETLLGERLDRNTKQVFEQLDYLKQQEVIQQAKKVEFQRLMQQQSGLARDSQAMRRANVEQMAWRRNLIKGAVLAAAATVTGVAKPAIHAAESFLTQ